VAALIAAGLEPSDFSLASPSLDEVFFALTGRSDSAGPEETRP
jgi:ABC-2 type transport system ATP-binding protein